MRHAGERGSALGFLLLKQWILASTQPLGYLLANSCPYGLLSVVPDSSIGCLPEASRAWACLPALGIGHIRHLL